MGVILHPGNSISEATHQVFGEKYFEILDQCKLGSVCKAGWRDRFVPKYAEFGMSWCLPVGDVPSYMENEMKKSMIVIGEDNQLFSFKELCDVIDVGLREYENRIVRYTSCLMKYHDMKKNIINLLSDIRCHNEHESNFVVIH